MYENEVTSSAVNRQSDVSEGLGIKNEPIKQPEVTKEIDGLFEANERVHKAVDCLESRLSEILSDSLPKEDSNAKEQGAFTVLGERLQSNRRSVERVEMRIYDLIERISL